MEQLTANDTIDVQKTSCLLSLSTEDVHDIVSRQYNDDELIKAVHLQFKRNLHYIYEFPQQHWIVSTRKAYCNTLASKFYTLNLVNTKHRSIEITSYNEFVALFRTGMQTRYNQKIFNHVANNVDINPIYKEILLAVVNKDYIQLKNIHRKQQIISACQSNNKSKFDVNQLVVGDIAPLLMACRLCDIKSVKILVEDFNADVNVVTRRGETPLLTATGYCCNEDIINCLIEHKADINYTSTCRTDANVSILAAAIKFDNLSFTKKLLANGVVLTDKVRVTFDSNNLQIFDIIYDKFPHIIKSQKRTICLYAIQTGSIDIIKRMIQLNLCEFSTKSVAYACMFANYDMLMTLESTNSFRTTFSYDGEQLIHFLALFTSNNCKKVYKPSANEIEFVYNNFEKIIDHFYGKEEDLMKIHTKYNYAPLHYAALTCDERVIEHILSKSKVDIATHLLWNPKIRTFDRLTRSPIVISVYCGHLYLVKKYFNEFDITHVYDLLLVAFRTENIILFEQILVMAIDKFKLNGKAIYHLISSMFSCIKNDCTNNSNNNNNIRVQLNVPIVTILMKAKRFESIMILHKLVGIDIYDFNGNYKKLRILRSSIVSQPIDLFISNYTPTLAKWQSTNYNSYTVQLKMEIKMLMVMWFTVTAESTTSSTLCTTTTTTATTITDNNKQLKEIKQPISISLLPIELISIIFDKLVLLEAFAVYCLMPTLNYESFAKYYHYVDR